MLSIGTIVAYTMVAISVLTSRYTPGVQSVTLQSESSRKKTRRWLESVCCQKLPAEGKDEVSPKLSYQQVATNEESSLDASNKPDEKTSFRARIGTFMLTLSITGMVICLTRAGTQLVRGEAWAVLLCCIFGIMIVISLVYIMRQPKNSATFPFMVPGVPIIPAITIFFNVLLIVMLNHWTYIRFGVWMAVGK